LFWVPSNVERKARKELASVGSSESEGVSEITSDGIDVGSRLENNDGLNVICCEGICVWYKVDGFTDSDTDGSTLFFAEGWKDGVPEKSNVGWIVSADVGGKDRPTDVGDDE